MLRFDYKTSNTSRQRNHIHKIPLIIIVLFLLLVFMCSDVFSYHTEIISLTQTLWGTSLKKPSQPLTVQTVSFSIIHLIVPVRVIRDLTSILKLCIFYAKIWFRFHLHTYMPYVQLNLWGDFVQRCLNTCVLFFSSAELQDLIELRVTQGCIIICDRKWYIEVTW